MARATASWWAASTSCHTAPVARASRVEPSMSVNRNVMVPTGGSPMAATLAGPWRRQRVTRRAAGQVTVIVACIPGWIVHSNLKVPAAAKVTSTLDGGGVLGFVSRTPVLRKPLP